MVEDFQEGVGTVGEVARAGVPKLEVVVQPDLIRRDGGVGRPGIRVENESKAVGIRGVPPYAAHPQLDRIFLQTRHIFDTHRRNWVGAGGAPAQRQDANGGSPRHEAERGIVADHSRLVVRIEVIIKVGRDFIEVDSGVIRGNSTRAVEAGGIVGQTVKALPEKRGGVGVGDRCDDAVEPGALVTIGHGVDVETLESAARKVEAGGMRRGEEP